MSSYAENEMMAQYFEDEMHKRSFDPQYKDKQFEKQNINECKKCHCAVKSSYKFCSNCGTKMEVN